MQDIKNIINEFRKYIPHSETYGWVAFLKDGRILKQYGENGEYTKFQEVLEEEKKSNLKSVFLISPFYSLPTFSVELREWQRIIFFIRNRLKVNTNEHERTYCLGWQATVNGRNVKSILFIDEEGNATLGEE